MDVDLLMVKSFCLSFFMDVGLELICVFGYRVVADTCLFGSFGAEVMNLKWSGDVCFGRFVYVEISGGRKPVE